MTSGRGEAEETINKCGSILVGPETFRAIEHPCSISVSSNLLSRMEPETGAEGGEGAGRH